MTDGSESGLAPGALLDGKYEILGLLGAGGMGEVYKARHVHLGAFRCIKVMKAALMADDAYRQRFLREARLATQIHHPNVAVVHDFSILPDRSSFMVTEFIDGTTVRQWASANGRFPLALATEVAMQALAGLDAIHRRGMTHRDVSADNLMLAFDADEHLVVKIIDLGVAKDATVSTNPIDTTQAGVFIGNPKYMSPEHLGELEEGETLDARADLYSLGVVIYEMLTGVPPFDARTPNGYIIKHLTEPPRTFAEATPGLDLPPGLEQVVRRTLEKDRNRRYANARELADALEPFASKAPRAFSRTNVPAGKTVALEPPTVTMEADQAWAFALAADNYAAFRDFRAKFPRYHADEAERSLEERMAFDTAAALDTEEAWNDYLERWSGDRHAQAARERLESARIREETAFSVAVEMKNAAAWQAYLDEFPGGGNSAAAERHLREELEFAEAKAADTVASWGLFLLNHPAGLREHDAQTRLSQLEEKDRHAWERASQANTAETLQWYLRTQPYGQFVADARRALARLAIIEGDFNAAYEAGTVDAWDAYLATHGSAPRAEDARRCRQEAAEFQLASSVDTKVMWRAFLKAWPDGRHRLDAEVRLK